jgi:signal transduction histidine kinase
MSPRSLRTRFLLAGVVFVTVMGACGVWSVVTFSQLGAVIGETLRDNQDKIDLTAALASGLEREDDALLLALTGNASKARSEYEEARRRFEGHFSHLQMVLTAGDEQEASDDLRRHVDAYRRAGDALLTAREPAAARETYHERVNPALREAVADCARLRELSFRAMRQAGKEADKRAWRASQIWAAMALTALVCVVAVTWRLARTVLADVTAIARLDELRSELVAVASHELKTPLTSLRMNLLLLRERADNLEARQTEILAAAVLAAEELAGTIDELLDLTRIEAGQLRLQRERVDLDVLMEQAARSLRPRFEDAAIHLHIVRETPAVVVQGDAARLRIVFLNLLDNALKYTPSGGEVEVRLASSLDASPRLDITVTDTGPGIPAAFRERIFEKFLRVEHHQEGQSKGVPGAGIGLYLCRQIVEAHGGSIRCELGAYGRGTRFLIDLPASEESEPRP